MDRLVLRASGARGVSPDAHPLEYVTSEALVAELASRFDTVIMLLHKRDKQTVTSLIHEIDGEYVVALGLNAMLPELIEQVLGQSVTDLDDEDE